jgi:hypothetical protein
MKSYLHYSSLIVNRKVYVEILTWCKVYGNTPWQGVPEEMGGLRVLHGVKIGNFLF